MGVIRISQITGRFFITQPDFEPQNLPGPKEHPVMSMVYRNGMLQRIYGDDDIEDWSVRIYENHRPVVTPDAEKRYGEYPHDYIPSIGHHYIMEASSGDATPAEECQRWADMLLAIQDRIRWLYEQSGVYYVAVFADMDKRSISTPCIQIATFQALPPSIQAEMDASDAASAEQGVCNICQVIKKISQSKRLVLKTEDFAAFCPWAPTSPYEFWIAPIKHMGGILRMSQREINELGMMLRTTLGGLTHIMDDVQFAMAFHFSLEDKSSNRMHWHVQIYPKTRSPTALERGFGMTLSNITPEEAAGEIRRAAREEMAAVVGVE